MQKRKRLVHWDEMCAAVTTRWGKNRHKIHMRQLLPLSQSGTVEEYTTKFEILRHQIFLADPNTNEVLFVERYLAGLHPEIRSAVILHHPEDVDTASCLALLQEVELENDKLLGMLRHSSRSSKIHNSLDEVKKNSGF